VFIKRRDDFYKWSKLNVKQGYRNYLLASYSEAENEKKYVMSDRLDRCCYCNRLLFSIICG
jgi:hypothetical protein